MADLRPESSPAAPPSWLARVFAASWLSYFSYYFTRMPVKATKTTLVREFGLSKAQLNYIDTAYNAAYCVGQVVNGFVTDRIGPRRWVALGMLLSAAIAVTFQQVHTVTGTVIGVYVLLWGLNGYAQSTGWPGNSKVMASWFGTRRRGEVMGWWSTCYQAGGMVATLAAARLIGAFGWRGVFVGTALWVAVIAVAFFLLVRDRPSDVGFADPDAIALGRDDLEERRRLLRAEWPRVLRTPMVWAMGGAYFCCKLIRYAFLLWLPFYLETALHYSRVDALDHSIFFELGGLVMVVIAGFVADRVFAKRRVAAAFTFLLGLVGALYLYQAIGDASSGAKTAQEAMDSLCAEQEKVLERLERAGIQGDGAAAQQRLGPAAGAADQCPQPCQ